MVSGTRRSSIIERAPGTAVRVPAATFLGTHNDTNEDATVVITSVKVAPRHHRSKHKTASGPSDGSGARPTVGRTA